MTNNNNNKYLITPKFSKMSLPFQFYEISFSEYRSLHCSSFFHYPAFLFLFPMPHIHTHSMT